MTRARLDHGRVAGINDPTTVVDFSGWPIVVHKNFPDELAYHIAGVLDKIRMSKVKMRPRSQDATPFPTPFLDRSPGFLGQRTQSPHEFISIVRVIDDPPPFNASDHHVVKRPRTVKPCLSRHTTPSQSSISLSGFYFVQLVNNVPYLLHTYSTLIAPCSIFADCSV